jgi:hypothetical protein
MFWMLLNAAGSLEDSKRDEEDDSKERCHFHCRCLVPFELVQWQFDVSTGRMSGWMARAGAQAHWVLSQSR